MKSAWCLGSEAYVSRRYLESYVNKEDAAVMAPGGEKVLHDIQRAEDFRQFTLDL